MGSDREYAPGLGETVCPRETPAQGDSAKSSELAACIPPLGDVHLAEPRNNKTKFQQEVEIDRCGIHRVSPFLLRSSAPPARTHSSTSEILNFQRRPIRCAG